MDKNRPGRLTIIMASRPSKQILSVIKMKKGARHLFSFFLLCV